MTRILLRDVNRYPDAFRMWGPVPVAVIKEWQQRRQCVVPDDLVELWATLGGGELFESETILDPSVGREESMDDENEALISMGLPLDLLVFHRGVCVSAIEQPSGEIVSLDSTTYQEIGRYDGMDDWYRQLLREEFAERYGFEPE